MAMKFSKLQALLLCLVALFSATPGEAQGTRADYARAERLLGWNAGELVIDGAVRPEWLPGDRFWYRNQGPEGYEFLVVDAASGTRRPAFDRVRLAAALSVAADTSYEPHKLPFQKIWFVDGERAIRFAVGEDRHWTCELSSYRCAGPDSVPIDTIAEVRSPDGRWVAFEREENLWVRSLQTGEEIQLSEDGEVDFGYAKRVGCCRQVTDVRAGREVRPFLVWSPDSRKIVTHRVDERGVRQLHLLETKNPGPVLHSYRYALPGDSVIPMYDLFVFDVASRGRLKVTPEALEVVNTTCCWLATDTIVKDVRWGSGSDEVFFTAGQRDFKRLRLVAADTRTGEARVVLTETSPTFVETNLNSGGVPNWRPINGNREVVWFSERDGWGHLYLYDARSGELKNRITSGPWVVSDLLHVDEAGRWVYFTAVGREAGRDPYFRHLYRVRLDGSGLQLLTPEDADHQVSISPSGRYILDNHSRRGSGPRTVVRRPDGALVREIQRADLRPLLATGWSYPEPFTVKARDGVTDLHGLLYRPSNFEPGRKYPIIDYIYPGPQVGSVGTRSFTTSAGGHAHALAELGFLVVQVDAMGTPLRSKAFPPRRCRTK
jgi:dipeptidyl-peptidase 4